MNSDSVCLYRIVTTVQVWVNILTIEAQNISSEKETQEISSPTSRSNQGPAMRSNQAALGFIQLNVEKDPEMDAAQYLWATSSTVGPWSWGK